MVQNEVWEPLLLALVSAILFVSRIDTSTRPSGARTESEEKTLDNPGQLPLTSGRFVTRRPAARVFAAARSRPALPSGLRSKRRQQNCSQPSRKGPAGADELL